MTDNPQAQLIADELCYDSLPPALRDRARMFNCAIEMAREEG